MFTGKLDLQAGSVMTHFVWALANFGLKTESFAWRGHIDDMQLSTMISKATKSPCRVRIVSERGIRIITPIVATKI